MLYHPATNKNSARLYTVPGEHNWDKLNILTVVWYSSNFARFPWTKHQELINKKTEVMKNQGNTLKILSKKREN